MTLGSLRAQTTTQPQSTGKHYTPQQSPANGFASGRSYLVTPPNYLEPHTTRKPRQQTCPTTASNPIQLWDTLGGPSQPETQPANLLNSTEVIRLLDHEVQPADPLKFGHSLQPCLIIEYSLRSHPTVKVCLKPT